MAHESFDGVNVYRVLSAIPAIGAMAGDLVVDHPKDGLRLVRRVDRFRSAIFAGQLRLVPDDNGPADARPALPFPASTEWN